MKEQTLVMMKRDIRNLTITLSIVLERIKKLEEQNESK